MIDPISWSHSWPYICTAFAIAYLLGSIPFGLLLTQIAGLGDIRKIGSGNIGATNVLRTGSKKLAAATLVLDGAKGAGAVLIGDIYGPDIAIVAATGSLLGHMFPVWLRFKGGKGVATALGILLSLSLPVGALSCGRWVLTAALSRYSSLSALLAIASSPIWMWWLADPQRMEFAIAMAFLIWLRHWTNIRRLLRGEEPQINIF
ncbi:MAG: glycerol-3-phosphate 1-O-acyltransferase PlsY [Pseudomonadota bacterium]|nr:glycerol-3-phosphate 1-O-acyltransferase PlsY [Pseudomonadota bacterium]